MRFYCYGENSATFLIFHALCRDNKVRCLLQTLRAAGNGRSIDETLFSQEDGKRISYADWISWTWPSDGRHPIGPTGMGA
jgi:hypothetical protein